MKNCIGVIRLPSGCQIEILTKLDAPEENLRGIVVEMFESVGKVQKKTKLNFL